MKSFIFLIVSLFMITSCASKKEVQEVEKKAMQSNVSDSKALGGTIHDLIANSKTLTDAQKTQLGNILEANKKRAEELQAESYKFRATLIQELLSGSPNMNNVKILKNEIRKIEKLRLKNTFSAVEKISNIVSSHPDNKNFSDHLINIDRVR